MFGIALGAIGCGEESTREAPTEDFSRSQFKIDSSLRAEILSLNGLEQNDCQSKLIRILGMTLLSAYPEDLEEALEESFAIKVGKYCQVQEKVKDEVQ